MQFLGASVARLGFEFGPKVFWLQRNIHEIVENRIKQNNVIRIFIMVKWGYGVIN